MSAALQIFVLMLNYSFQEWNVEVKERNQSFISEFLPSVTYLTSTIQHDCSAWEGESLGLFVQHG